MTSRSRTMYIGFGAVLVAIFIGTTVWYKQSHPAMEQDPPQFFDRVDQAPMALTISSSAFKTGEPIPEEFSCNGKNVPPPLTLGSHPPAVKSMVLVLEDPDANDFVHWLVWNIPRFAKSIGGEATASAITGTNSAGKSEYMGPCPPSGQHRYYFHLYGINTELSLPTTATRQDVLDAMVGHIVARGELMGTYAKK